MSKPSVLVYLTALVLATAGSYLTGIFPFSRINKTDPSAIVLDTNASVENTSIPIATTVDPEAKESAYRNALDYLILAEIAKMNEQDSLALTYYQHAFTVSQSAEVAQEATELALEAGDPSIAIEFAQAWAKVDPHDLSAQLVAMTLLLPSDHKLAEQYLTQAFVSDPEGLATHLSLVQSRLPEEGRALLYQAIVDLAKQQINSPEAQALAAQAAIYEQQFTQANSYLEATFRLKPEMTTAIKLKAKLIRYNDKNDQQALSYLLQKVNTFPENDDLRAFYAHALIESKQYPEAIKQLEHLLKKDRYRSITLLLLGEVYHLMGNETTALTYVNQALNFPEYQAAAHYLLGEIYQQQKNFSLALTHFSNITEGEYHVPAILNSAIILNKNQQFEEALDILRSAEPSDFQEQKQLLLLEVSTLINAKNIAEASELLSHILHNLPEDPDFLKQQESIEKINLR